MCERRGEMLRSPSARDATLGRNEANTGHESRQTVAGGACIMANVFHEALCFLKGLSNGHVRLNSHSQPLTLTVETEAVATMVYLNDVLINVDAAIIGILSSPRILEAYGIVWDPQCSEAWNSGTPEGISGETRLLGQTGIFPSRLAVTMPQLAVATSRSPVVGS